MPTANTTLVLIHGFAFDQRIWQDLIAQLPTQIPVTCVDLAGYGTQKQNTAEDLHSLAAHVCAQITTPAIWCGWSLGGLVATQCAQQAPTRTQGLVHIASNPKFIADANWPHGIDAQAFAQLRADFIAQPARAWQQFLFLQTQGQAQAKAGFKALKQRFAAPACHDTHTLLRDFDLLANTDQRADLATLGCPTLALFADHDALVPVQVADHLKNLYPRLQTAKIKQAGHMPFLSHTAHCAQLIEEFYHDC